MATSETLARQFHELTDQQDWAAREALFAEESEFVTPVGAMHGPAAMTAFSQGFMGAFSDTGHVIEVVASGADAAVVEGVWSGTQNATGQRVDLPFAATVRTADGLITSVRIYFDQVAFMSQLAPPAPARDAKATIGQMFDEIINLGKLDLIEDLFDPEFQTNTPQGTMDRDGFKAYVAAWRAGFPDIVCEVGDLVVEGDAAGWSVRATGTHTGDFMGIPATGRTVDFDSLNVGTFRDGRALTHTVMMDIPKMMAQLGVGGA